MTDLEMLKEAFARGEFSACVGVADEMAEQGHPHAEELCELAVIMTTHESALDVQLAGANFLLLLELS